MKGKLIVGIIAAVVVLGGGYYVYSAKVAKANAVPEGPVVSTSVVEMKPIEESISLKAPLEGTESVEVVSRLHSKILKIYVKEGDKVTEGQLLAELDTEDISREITEAQDNVSLLQNQLNEKLRDKQNSYEAELLGMDDLQKAYDDAVLAKNDVERDYEDKKRIYEETKTLYDAGIEIKDNLIKAENDMLNAESEITKAQSNIEKAENAIKDKEQKIATYNVKDGTVAADASDLKNIEIARKTISTKRDNLDDCKIVSTINGTVTRVNVKTGRFADETEDDKPMFIIENVDKLQMVISVSEYDIGKVKIGQEVVITADMIGDDEVKGVVSRISPTGELESGQSNKRVIPIQVDIENSTSGLIAGITANAKIIIAKSDSTLVVPIECIYEDENGEVFLYVVNDENKLEIKKVETGIESDLEIEVKGDISEGDIVVVNPDMTMTEGMTVSTGLAPSEAQEGEVVNNDVENGEVEGDQTENSDDSNTEGQEGESENSESQNNDSNIDEGDGQASQEGSDAA